MNQRFLLLWVFGLLALLGVLSFPPLLAHKSAQDTAACSLRRAEADAVLVIWGISELPGGLERFTCPRNGEPFWIGSDSTAQCPNGHGVGLPSRGEWFSFDRSR
ncbi:MAG: hypothetical protein QGH20_06630 [Candidatus Latescibacteria bacterium]|jgi:hypothetical protein|nr:hypothetical protein [Candidatus Latescibacterota bacterium]